MKLIVPILIAVLIAVCLFALKNNFDALTATTPQSYKSELSWKEQLLIYQKHQLDIDWTKMKGFDAAGETVPGYQELEEKIEARVKAEIATVRSDTQWMLILNLLVTFLTALVTLITTISTIKTKSVTVMAAILIACLTFVSSLMSFGQSHFSKDKEEAQQKIESIKKLRTRLEETAEKDMPTQIKHIQRELDEI